MQEMNHEHAHVHGENHPHTHAADTHGSGAHTHGSSAHTHGSSADTHDNSAYTHGSSAYTHGSSAHTHGSSAHTHGSSAHTHDHGAHTHVHTEEEKKRRLNRISRVIGHLEHIRDMIERDAGCTEILIQLSACRSAINGLARQIINEHISGCVSEAVRTGDHEALEALQKAIDKFI